VISPPNPKPEILDILASFSIISVLTVDVSKSYFNSGEEVTVRVHWNLHGLAGFSILPPSAAVG